MQSKLPNVGTTIFTVMSKMAQDHNAINLSQGFPDFDCPERLKELVSYYLNDRRNQYPPMTGIPALREQIAKKVSQYYGYDADPETEVTVTSGATEALFDAIQAVVSAGDEVIVFDPAYDSYEPAVILAGAKTIHIPMSQPDYSIDWDRVEQSLSEKTRLIIINSPHNPCGSLLQDSDFDTLARIIRDRNILVLSDEVYEHMVFDGVKHKSVLSHPELREKSFAVFSFGKTYHATGWKIGYPIANKDLSRELRKVHQYNTYCSAAPLQVAMARFMKETQSHFGLPAFYQQKRDFFLEQIADTKFVPLKCNGTYFQMLNFSQISTAQDVDFARSLTKDFGVASIPTSPFYHDKFDPKVLRFCFAKSESTLKQAGARLSKASS